MTFFKTTFAVTLGILLAEVVIFAVQIAMFAVMR
jgi:hypothetical protein